MTGNMVLCCFMNGDDRIQFIDRGIIDILPDYCIPEWDNGDIWSIYLDEVITDGFQGLYDLFSTNKDKWGIV